MTFGLNRKNSTPIDGRQALIALGVLVVAVLLLAFADWKLAPDTPRWDSTIGPHPR